jgi:hypothetical protein
MKPLDSALLTDENISPDVVAALRFLSSPNAARIVS